MDGRVIRYSHLLTRIYSWPPDADHGLGLAQRSSRPDHQGDLKGSGCEGVSRAGEGGGGVWTGAMEQREALVGRKEVG